MQWKRAHVVLVCTKGPNNNSLQVYILVYYYAEEAGEIVLGIEVARELEIIFCYFYILKSVKSVDTQPALIDAQREHVPTLMEHFQTVWRNGECIGILVVKIPISSHYDVVALHGINYIRKEMTARRNLLYKDAVFERRVLRQRIGCRIGIEQPTRQFAIGKTLGVGDVVTIGVTKYPVP